MRGRPSRQVQAASQQPVELAAKPAGRETQHPAAQQQQPPPPVALTAKPAGAAPSAAQGAAPQPPAPPEPLPAPERPHTPSPEAVERASEPTVRPPPPKKPPRKPWQRTPWDSDSDEELLAPVRQQPAPPGPAAPPAEAAPAARRMEIRKLEQQAGKAGAPWHDEHGQQHREVTPEQRQKTRELNRQIALAGQASNRTFDVKVGGGAGSGGCSGHHAQMVLSEEARLLAVLEKEEAPAAQEVVAGAAARQQQGLRKLAMGVLLGQAITVRVLKVPEDPANQRILLSERLALAADSAPQLLAAPQLAAAAAMADAAAVVDCLVLRVADFGVVVEFNLPDGEAIVGLLPPNQVSWEDATPAGAPAVKPGQVVRAAVMRVSRSKARVFLSARHAFAQGVLDALDAGADERPELGPALPEAARFCAAIQEARGVVEATPGARARTPGVAQQLELYFKLGRLAPEPRGERGGAAGDGAPARDGQRAFASNLATHVLLLRAGRSAQVVAVTTTLHREEFKRLALDVNVVGAALIKQLSDVSQEVVMGSHEARDAYVEALKLPSSHQALQHQLSGVPPAKANSTDSTSTAHRGAAAHDTLAQQHSLLGPLRQMSLDVLAATELRGAVQPLPERQNLFQDLAQREELPPSAGIFPMPSVQFLESLLEDLQQGPGGAGGGSGTTGANGAGGATTPGDLPLYLPADAFDLDFKPAPGGPCDQQLAAAAPHLARASSGIVYQLQHSAVLAGAPGGGGSGAHAPYAGGSAHAPYAGGAGAPLPPGMVPSAAGAGAHGHHSLPLPLAVGYGGALPGHGGYAGAAMPGAASMPLPDLRQAYGGGLPAVRRVVSVRRPAQQQQHYNPYAEHLAYEDAEVSFQISKSGRVRKVASFTGHKRKSMGEGVAPPSAIPRHMATEINSVSESHDSWRSAEDSGSEVTKGGSRGSRGGSGRRGKKGKRTTCLNCGAHQTPQWRCGPLGPRTLCNACGVRFKKGLPLSCWPIRDGMTLPANVELPPGVREQIQPHWKINYLQPASTDSC
eukprot:scaffold3.g6460.t1